VQPVDGEPYEIEADMVWYNGLMAHFLSEDPADPGFVDCEKAQNTTDIKSIRLKEATP
jgi:hypothetical protein